MPKLQTLTNNFTGGERSPKLKGRADMDRYNASAETLENCVVLRQGGITMRPSRDFAGEIKDSTFSGRIIPFVYSRTDAYLIELGEFVMRVWRGGALVESSPGVPFELATPWNAGQLAALDFTQGGDTIIVTHPNVAPQRILRFGDASWRCEPAPFKPAAIAEIGQRRAGVTMTLSSPAVGARTLTASGAYFVRADVGRRMSWGQGTLTIDSYTSNVQMAVTVTGAFASAAAAGNTWLLEGSPRGGIAASATGPIGTAVSVTGGGSANLGPPLTVLSASWVAGAVNMTLSAAHGWSIGQQISVAGMLPALYNGSFTLTVASGADIEFVFAVDPGAATQLGTVQLLTPSTNEVWRSDDVGRWIEIAGGLIEITGFNSITQVSGIVRRELSTVGSQPADAWALRSNVWNDIDGQPTSCTLWEQRLWFGGTRRFPQGVWGSRPGLFFDFLPGTDDDSAVYKTMDSDDNNLVQYLAGLTQLVALTYGGEFDIRGGVEKPVTQSNAQIKKRSRWGSDAVRPEEAGTALLFAERGGSVLRELQLGPDGLVTRDISLFSDHLLAQGIRWLAWEQRPEQTMWIGTTEGKLLAVTYGIEPAQNTIAFCSGAAQGIVEWGVTIPDGAIDATYLLVRYFINGGVRRYIERLNWAVYPGQDSRMQATVGVAQLVWPAFAPHLVGETVALLADATYIGTAVVGAGGDITLPRAALTLSAGLPYAATAVLSAPEVGTGTGTSQGQQQSTHEVLVRFHQTIGCKVNGHKVPFRTLDAPLLDQAPVPQSVLENVGLLGWDKESPLSLVQDMPYPWTILAVIRNMTINPG